MSDSAALIQVGSRVRVLPEFDIPEMFRNGPSEGVVERIDAVAVDPKHHVCVVIVDGKAVPYAPHELEVIQMSDSAATSDLDYLRANGLCATCREPLTEKEKALEGVGGSYVRCDECMQEIMRNGPEFVGGPRA